MTRSLDVNNFVYVGNSLNFARTRYETRLPKNKTKLPLEYTVVYAVIIIKVDLAERLIRK